MTLKDCLRVLRERWLIVLSFVGLAVAAGGIFGHLQSKEYTSTLTLYVSAQSLESTAAAYDGARLSEQRVTSYLSLIESDQVMGEVISDLGLPITAEALAKQLTVSSETNSVLINVAVADESPQRAMEIANSVGRVFPNLVSELERPASPDGVPHVVVRVAQPATAPVAPSSASLSEILALGVLAGLALGIGAALVRNAMDRSIKSAAQLEDETGAANLGMVAFDANMAKQPLIMFNDPRSGNAEAFRQLRTNIQFVDMEHQAKVVTVTSGLPTEGKTTTLVNLATALAAAGTRVVAVEADLRQPKLADMLELDFTVGLSGVIAGRVQLREAIQRCVAGFDVLCSGALPSNPSELLASQQMEGLLDELRRQYDVVLVDTTPVLAVADATAVAPATDGAILVCRWRTTTREHIGAAVGALERVGVPLLGTVLTFVPKAKLLAYRDPTSFRSLARQRKSVPQATQVDPPVPIRARTGTPVHRRAAEALGAEHATLRAGSDGAGSGVASMLGGSATPPSYPNRASEARPPKRADALYER